MFYQCLYTEVFALSPFLFTPFPIFYVAKFEKEKKNMRARENSPKPFGLQLFSVLSKKGIFFFDIFFPGERGAFEGDGYLVIWPAFVLFHGKIFFLYGS